MFNLSKYAQAGFANAPMEIADASGELADGIQNELDLQQQGRTDVDSGLEDVPVDTDEVEDQRILDLLEAKNALEQMDAIIAQQSPEAQGRLRMLEPYVSAQQKATQIQSAALGYESSDAKKAKFSQLEQLAMAGDNQAVAQAVTDFERDAGIVDTGLADLQQFQEMQDQQQSAGVYAETKTAQQSGFPVADAGDLASKFLNRLVTNDPDVYVTAAEEILDAVRGEIQEEEINSMVESLLRLGPDDQSKAMRIFGSMFEILPAQLKGQAEAPAAPAAPAAPMPQPMPMEPVMSEKNPKGIIKHNLSDHVINNKKSETVGMVKTAADQFGHQYLLYGPTEKRICPKLRGKGGGQPGSGDVVSEYICRHHCLDGIVIDDNKTVCGEALWRANAMDKFSREYVNEDGEIEGGYLNKRFEINRNVPEENKMRLKPGESRKPRPAEWGNTESRMQAMRQKQAQERGYKPDSNTGDAFEWCHDQDQNNVEQPQSTRDKREQAMGHETVQYTNKNKQENNPKKASFNLSKMAGAKCCDCGCDKCECSCNPADTGEAYSTMINRRNRENDKSGFNLKKHKTAQFGSIPITNPGPNSDRRLEDPKHRPKPMVGGPAMTEQSEGDGQAVQEMTELAPQKTDTHVVPGMDKLDDAGLQNIEDKNFGIELRDFVTQATEGGGLSIVSSSLTTGQRPNEEAIKSAIHELENEINSGLAPEYAEKAREHQERLRSMLSDQPDPMRMAKSSFNLKNFKDAGSKKKR